MFIQIAGFLLEVNDEKLNGLRDKLSQNKLHSFDDFVNALWQLNHAEQISFLLMYQSSIALLNENRLIIKNIIIDLMRINAEAFVYALNHEQIDTFNLANCDIALTLKLNIERIQAEVLQTNTTSNLYDWIDKYVLAPRQIRAAEFYQDIMRDRTLSQDTTFLSLCRWHAHLSAKASSFATTHAMIQEDANQQQLKKSSTIPITPPKTPVTERKSGIGALVRSGEFSRHNRLPETSVSSSDDSTSSPESNKEIDFSPDDSDNFSMSCYGSKPPSKKNTPTKGFLAYYADYKGKSVKELQADDSDIDDSYTNKLTDWHSNDESMPDDLVAPAKHPVK